MLVLSTGDVFTIGIALAALIVGIIAFMRTHPNATPAALDAEAARQIALVQHNRDLVGKLETAYQTSGQMQQQALSTVAALLKALAPLTPLKVDDAGAALLEDIQTPGAPPPTLPPG